MTALSTALQRLLTDGVATASAFTAKQRAELEQFAISTRLVSFSKTGRSTVYQVVDSGSVYRYLQQLQPLTDAELGDHLPERSRNIGKHRDSKHGKTRHDCGYVLMKAWAANVVWQAGDNCLPVAQLTAKVGVAALQIKLGETWRCNAPLLLVENLALFNQCDWLPADFQGCLVYYQGQLSGLLLAWLGEYPRSDRLIFFPDYDGVGLNNYARLAAARHPDSALQFYWLPDWQAKLVRFGLVGLWQKTSGQFDHAIHQLDGLNALDANLRELYALARQHGKALEQEVVWLVMDKGEVVV